MAKIDIQKNIFSRQDLIQAHGVNSTYLDKDKKNIPLEKLALGKMTQDAFDALLQLKQAVEKNSGNLFVSDVFRDWNMQADAHEKYLQGIKKSYASPPGCSWHGAGRAIDIDVSNLNFRSVKKEEHLSLFWKIAKPLGWMPIIAEPKNVSESWHFQYPGIFSRWIGRADDGDIASAATLDVGCWDASDPNLRIRFLQAQLNRVGNVFLKMDGHVGMKTRAAMSIFSLPENVDDAILNLVSRA